VGAAKTAALPQLGSRSRDVMGTTGATPSKVKHQRFGEEEEVKEEYLVTFSSNDAGGDEGGLRLKVHAALH